MIKAIIFDCFGVLISENWLQFKNEKFGNDPIKLARVSELNSLVDTGVLGYDEYVEQISKMSQIPTQELNKIFRNGEANRGVLDMLPKLKNNYKLGMLSNISSDNFLNFLTPQEVDLFDDLTLSYRIGIIKPDPRSFQIAASNLGEPCENCLLIDDQPKNITAAKERGMQGIVFTDLESCSSQLLELGIVY